MREQVFYSVRVKRKKILLAKSVLYFFLLHRWAKIHTQYKDTMVSFVMSQRTPASLPGSWRQHQSDFYLSVESALFWFIITHRDGKKKVFFTTLIFVARINQWEFKSDNPNTCVSPHTAPQRSCFCPRRSKTPTADGPSSGCQLAPPFLPGLVPWPLWTFHQRVRPQPLTGPPSPGRKSHSLPLCSTEVGVKKQKTVRKHLRGRKIYMQKNSRENFIGMIKMFCFILWFHLGGQGQEFVCLRLWERREVHTK